MAISLKDVKEDKEKKSDAEEPKESSAPKTEADVVLKEIEGGELTMVELVEAIIKLAFLMKASDVHIEPQEKALLIRYRLDGILREIVTLDKALEESLIFRIKVASKLRTDEHFAPQDGKIRFLFGDEFKLDTRISILPITKGEKVVIRLLSQDGQMITLEDLGLEGRDLSIVTKSYQKPYGMILCTGPTGSGKTTMLYSILKILNSPERNITTIEDPVEYDLDRVNHIQVNTKADLTFANGLKSILRQDPDIVMVGEIRDKETAKIAINAAMTGHLLLSTLHTNDAITTIPRLVDMGVEPFLVASTINVVIAQRLARRLCSKCKKETKITNEQLKDLSLSRPDLATLLNPDEVIFEPVGCTVCTNSGYKGRVGLYEVLEVNESVRRMIVDSTKTTDDIFALARKQGLVLIVEDGVRKAREGMTSIEEIVRVTALKE
jgi:type II secretory ATPase GspE/PulE/Tfp pilus assembly ATPase PilB-like protein